jgi:hypothetical protein
MTKLEFSWHKEMKEEDDVEKDKKLIGSDVGYKVAVNH